MAIETYRPVRTLVIEVDIQSAIADERLFTRVLDGLRSGEGDVVFFGVTRLVSKSKRVKDATEVRKMRVKWADEQ